MGERGATSDCTPEMAEYLGATLQAVCASRRLESEGDDALYTGRTKDSRDARDCAGGWGMALLMKIVWLSERRRC